MVLNEAANRSQYWTNLDRNFTGSTLSRLVADGTYQITGPYENFRVPIANLERGRGNSQHLIMLSKYLAEGLRFNSAAALYLVEYSFIPLAAGVDDDLRRSVAANVLLGWNDKLSDQSVIELVHLGQKAGSIWSLRAARRLIESGQVNSGQLPSHICNQALAQPQDASQVTAQIPSDPRIDVETRLLSSDGLTTSTTVVGGRAPVRFMTLPNGRLWRHDSVSAEGFFVFNEVGDPQWIASYGPVPSDPTATRIHKGPAILIDDRFVTHNVSHLLFDKVVRYLALDGETEIQPVVFQTSPVVEEVLKLLKLPPPIVVGPGECVQFASLCVPTDLVQTEHSRVVHSEAARKFVRRRLDTTSTLSSPSRILISRSDARVRQLTNEDDIAVALGPNFVRVRLSGLHFRDQVQILIGAEVVVSPHGAGLTVPSIAGQGIVELLPPGNSSDEYALVTTLSRGAEAYVGVLSDDRQARAKRRTEFDRVGFSADPTNVREAVRLVDRS